MDPYAFRIREPVSTNGRPIKKPALDSDDELVTIKGAAELCKVDPAFIRKAIAGLDLRVVILGPKTHRLRKSELRRWWKARETRAVIP
jgi:hypothetical protein